MLRRDYNLRNVLLCLGSTFGSFVVSIGTWHSCVQWIDGGAAARFLGGIFLFSLPAILWERVALPVLELPTRDVVRRRALHGPQLQASVHERDGLRGGRS